MLCSDFIDEVVDRNVALGRKFTAFEISKEVQFEMKRNNLAFTRHTEMRDYIHSILEKEVQAGTYQKNLVDVGHNNQAFQYSPTAKVMPSIPVSQVKTVLSSKITPNFTQPSQTMQVRNPFIKSGPIAKPKSYKRVPDKRGSITVPAELTKKIKDRYADVFYDLKDDCLVITANFAPKTHKLELVACYSTKYGIRLTRHCLNQIGLAQSYQVFEDNGLIKVSM